MRQACRQACSISSTAMGPAVGAALSAHPDVDMMSFTGSTRAGTAVMKACADGIKKVALELGGKSPNIILDDADLQNRRFTQHDAHGDEHRPKLQRALAHAGAEIALRRSGRHRRRDSECNQGAGAGSRGARRDRPTRERATNSKKCKASSRRASTKARKRSPAASAGLTGSIAAITCAPPCSPTSPTT